MIDIEEFLEFLHSFPFKSSAFLNLFALHSTRNWSFLSVEWSWINWRFEPARFLVESMELYSLDWILVSFSVLEDTGEACAEDWTIGWTEGWTEDSTDDGTVASDEG